jgi:hypothetical protein
VENDPWATIEIQYMMKDVKERDKETGKTKGGIEFDNNKEGIIAVEYEEGGGLVESKRVTYLPSVFEGKEESRDWNKISKSLMNKGNIKDKKNTKFYSYRTVKTEEKMIDIMKSEKMRKILFVNYIEKMFSVWTTNFKKFIDKENDKMEFPFMIDGEDNVTIDKEETVRNISSIKESMDIIDVLMEKVKHEQHRANLVLFKRQLSEWFEYYSRRYKTLEEQALSFLVLGIGKEEEEKIKYIREKLMNRLKSPYIERDFELPEIMLGLLDINEKQSDEKITKGEILYILESKMSKNENEFKWNWYGKVLNKLKCENNKVNTGHHVTRCEILQDKNKDYISNYVLKTHSSELSFAETNKLVVMFEGLYDKLYLSDYKIQRLYLLIFCELVKRYKNGLVAFKDGTYRIDITMHFLNGFSKLK